MNAALSSRIVELKTFVALLVEKITGLERLVKGDSSNSSRPPSSDDRTTRNKRPIANGRKLNNGPKRRQVKQPGAPGASVKARPDPDLVVVLEPPCCRGCGAGLDNAATVGEVSRQAIYLLCRQHVPQQRCAEALSSSGGDSRRRRERSSGDEDDQQHRLDDPGPILQSCSGVCRPGDRATTAMGPIVIAIDRSSQSEQPALTRFDHATGAFTSASARPITAAVIVCRSGSGTKRLSPRRRSTSGCPTFRTSTRT